MKKNKWKEIRKEKIMRKKKGERRKKKMKNLSKIEGKWINNLINELLSESIYKIDEKIIDGRLSNYKEDKELKWRYL